MRSCVMAGIALSAAFTACVNAIASIPLTADGQTGQATLVLSDDSDLWFRPSIDADYDGDWTLHYFIDVIQNNRIVAQTTCWMSPVVHHPKESNGGLKGCHVHLWSGGRTLVKARFEIGIEPNWIRLRHADLQITLSG